ncbi:hypothetical protein ACFLWN_03485 [Chloroflexota bacterium]
MGKSTLSKRRGKYGGAKYCAFMVLQQLGPERGRDAGWLSTRELAILTGLPYRSLTRLLPRWTRWEYVTRREASIKGRGAYEYLLLPHGKAWLKVARERLYNRNQFFNELKAWVSEVSGSYELLLHMPFNSMLSHIEILRYKGVNNGS